MDLYGADDLAGYCQTAASGADLLVHTQSLPDLKHPVARVGWVGLQARVARSGFGITPKFAPRMRVGAAEYVGPDSTPVASFTTYTADLPGWRLELNPETGKAWTWAEALAALIGLRDTSPPGGHLLRCTSLLKQVLVVFAHPSAVRVPC